MLGKRVRVMFRHRSNSDNYLRQSRDQERNIYSKAEKKADKSRKEIENLLPWQAHGASEHEYRKKARSFSDDLFYIKQEANSPHNTILFNKYPKLTGELRECQEEMRVTIRQMKATKISCFTYLRQKIQIRVDQFNHWLEHRRRFNRPEPYYA